MKRYIYIFFRVSFLKRSSPVHHPRSSQEGEPKRKSRKSRAKEGKSGGDDGDGGGGSGSGNAEADVIKGEIRKQQEIAIMSEGEMSRKGTSVHLHAPCEGSYVSLR